jgi:RNA polymerase sigma factor (sigma-70 family)
MASAVPELPVLARDQAFETLYRSHVKDVYHYALALLRNPADAEDVTQTTFLNAYRAYQRGEEIRKPQNWLIKIAHNVARTRYAHASRRVKEVPLEDHVGQLAVTDDEKPNIEGVLQALGRLPFNQRAALVMRELEGRSYAEIADTLDVSVPAVETLIFRARKALRLRASALRVLTAVPLPGSLTQLFETGVTSGGAVVGTGFLVKAMMALVVGAVATGIGGDRSGGARSAADPGGRVAGTPASTVGNGPLVNPFRTPTVKGVRAGVGSGRQGPAKTNRGTGIAGRLAAGKAVDQGSTRTTSRAAGSPAAPSSAADRSSTAPITAAASTLLGQVQETVAAAAAALPVQVPALPSIPQVPVQVPPVQVPPVQVPPVQVPPVQVPPLPPLPKVP